MAKTKRKCKHVGCNNKPAPNRRECEKCKSANQRQRDPVAYAYYFLKGNAKRRKKVFQLDLPWFREWVKENGYMQHKGRGADNFTIDRERNLEGYTKDNIRILTKHENCVKYSTIDILAELGPQTENIPF
jgi:hypothetical protein